METSVSVAYWSMFSASTAAATALLTSALAVNLQSISVVLQAGAQGPREVQVPHGSVHLLCGAVV